ncbi:hypothetical protein HMPREF1137_1448 [Actinomyces sp. ICM39]|nr:hypothetical protein HMPREF1137_1448 [Actinomyces sp. ICM39]
MSSRPRRDRFCPAKRAQLRAVRRVGEPACARHNVDICHGRAKSVGE